MLVKSHHSSVLHGNGAFPLSTRSDEEMDRCIDVAVRKISKLSRSEDCRYIRSCVGLHPVVELVKSKTVKFVSSVVETKVLSHVFWLAFSDLFTFAC